VEGKKRNEKGWDGRGKETPPRTKILATALDLEQKLVTTLSFISFHVLEPDLQNIL